MINPKIKVYLSITIIPSKRLNPLEIYLNGPSPINFNNISIANMHENIILLVSTIEVSSSGWLWYSMPMLRVLIKMAKSIPCWKYLWSTILLTHRRKTDKTFRMQEKEQKDDLLEICWDQLKYWKRLFTFLCTETLSSALYFLTTTVWKQSNIVRLVSSAAEKATEKASNSWQLKMFGLLFCQSNMLNFFSDES